MPVVKPRAEYWGKEFIPYGNEKEYLYEKFSFFPLFPCLFPTNEFIYVMCLIKFISESQAKRN